MNLIKIIRKFLIYQNFQVKLWIDLNFKKRISKKNQKNPIMNIIANLLMTFFNKEKNIKKVLKKLFILCFKKVLLDRNIFIFSL